MADFKNKYLPALIAVLGCEAIGITSAMISPAAQSQWFQNLQKPWFNPPSWIFAPVWTLLYALMGIAAAIIWNKRKQTNTIPALSFFGLQLILNFLWTPIFFGLQRPVAALIEIFLLLFALIITMVLFWKISPKAGVLLIPYLLWVGFASILNASIARMNG